MASNILPELLQVHLRLSRFLLCTQMIEEFCSYLCLMGDKESTCQWRCKKCGFDPWVGKIPRSRKWQLTPVFLPGKFHGQRNLAGYSPWGHRVGHDWVSTHNGIRQTINRSERKSHWGFPSGSDSKESACNAGYPGSILGSRRSPGEGNGNSFQYSCLENSMDRGAWWVTVHGVVNSQTWLND